jgi:hypothetical protein
LGYLNRNNTVANDKMPEEDTTPKLGEFVAHRVWWADHNDTIGWHLRSVYLYSDWKPHTPMEGHPEWSGNGVHGWKTQADLDAYAQDCLSLGRIFVKGTVELWGMVDEYETGYRAQFAYPFTLDEILFAKGSLQWDELTGALRLATSPPDDLLEILRRKYLG